MLSEAEAFDDIVVGDFKDSYQNLSLKMAMVLQWVDLYCASAKYMLKADEDTFINVPLLLNVLHVLSANTSHFLLGFIKPGLSLHVARSGRYAVSERAYPLRFWPQYMYGHSYVMSGDAISSLRRVSRHLPLIPNEDAYVTGVLAKSAGTQRVHSGHFAMFWRTDRCDLVYNTDISQTGFRSSAKYHEMWKMFQTGKCLAGN
ncbi:lactosylceramide 1,3-N-acetyl-beta-D-glucosaminyltransferase-like [Babylonia areolata]|uniref:lactosylceramide 1,3-N-acetyl-beta-D-glucosaminyltransferase-like n=1 Tax=Babylonia areolata TaxID=304850 RepID=UPI003FD324F7